MLLHFVEIPRTRPISAIKIMTDVPPYLINGSGIPVYRKLQRQGIPFAAGVLHENDLDYPVAKALAVQVISERPYEPIGEAAYEEALRVMEKCRTVICSVQEFGSGNLKNADLLQRFMKKG